MGIAEEIVESAFDKKKRNRMGIAYIHGYKFVKRKGYWWLVDNRFYGVEKNINLMKYIPSETLFKFRTKREAEEFLKKRVSI